MTKRVKLVRLIPVLDFGGVETMFELWSQVVDHERYEVRVCTFWNDGAAATAIRANGIPVDVLHVNPSIRNPRATFALARYLWQIKPDILQASIGEANFHAALIGRLLSVPVVMMEEHGVPDRPLPYRLVHAALYRMVDAVIGVSQVALDYVVQHEYAPRSRTRLLYNAVAEQFFAPVRPRTDKDNFHYVTVGRLHPVKNHRRLIYAFADVVRERPDVKLTIVGGGSLKDELEQLIDSLALTNHVSLLGYSGEVMPIVDEADCFVFPSLSEAFGIGAIEAMARGIPIIASSADALPEIVGDIGPQWIVDPHDVEGWTLAMRAMASLDSDTRAALGRKARAIAERYTLARYAASLENIYKGLLERKAVQLGA